MTLYHGTNADFERISLTIGLRYKDFGHGFYATPDRQTAIRMTCGEGLEITIGAWRRRRHGFLAACRH